eukprot:TRINITY_DN9956_c0_g1_i2.p1 TRINITY_DN9956_c0_g1~~TRINITY_DN9956_c0_g1_i2.p1  ORF type:complete len:1062 (+),score=183.94 TRINITY_DN9956_c0_g1_i2:130-3315(+)
MREFGIQTSLSIPPTDVILSYHIVSSGESFTFHTRTDPRKLSSILALLNDELPADTSVETAADAIMAITQSTLPSASQSNHRSSFPPIQQNSSSLSTEVVVSPKPTILPQMQLYQQSSASSANLATEAAERNTLETPRLFAQFTPHQLQPYSEALQTKQLGPSDLAASQPLSPPQNAFTALHHPIMPIRNRSKSNLGPDLPNDPRKTLLNSSSVESMPSSTDSPLTSSPSNPSPSNPSPFSRVESSGLSQSSENRLSSPVLVPLVNQSKPETRQRSISNPFHGNPSFQRELQLQQQLGPSSHQAAYPNQIPPWVYNFTHRNISLQTTNAELTILPQLRNNPDNTSASSMSSFHDASFLKVSERSAVIPSQTHALFTQADDSFRTGTSAPISSRLDREAQIAALHHPAKESHPLTSSIGHAGQIFPDHLKDSVATHCSLNPSDHPGYLDSVLANPMGSKHIPANLPAPAAIAFLSESADSHPHTSNPRPSPHMGLNLWAQGFTANFPLSPLEQQLQGRDFVGNASILKRQPVQVLSTEDRHNSHHSLTDSGSLQTPPSIHDASHVSRSNSGHQLGKSRSKSSVETQSAIEPEKKYVPLTKNQHMSTSSLETKSSTSDPAFKADHAFTSSGDPTIKPQYGPFPKLKVTSSIKVGGESYPAEFVILKSHSPLPSGAVIPEFPYGPSLVTNEYESHTIILRFQGKEPPPQTIHSYVRVMDAFQREVPDGLRCKKKSYTRIALSPGEHSQFQAKIGFSVTSCAHYKISIGQLRDTHCGFLYLNLVVEDKATSRILGSMLCPPMWILSKAPSYRFDETSPFSTILQNVGVWTRSWKRAGCVKSYRGREVKGKLQKRGTLESSGPVSLVSYQEYLSMRKPPTHSQGAESGSDAETISGEGSYVQDEEESESYYSTRDESGTTSSRMHAALSRIASDKSVSEQSAQASRPNEQRQSEPTQRRQPSDLDGRQPTQTVEQTMAHRPMHPSTTEAAKQQQIHSPRPLSRSSSRSSSPVSAGERQSNDYHPMQHPLPTDDSIARLSPPLLSAKALDLNPQSASRKRQRPHPDD